MADELSPTVGAATLALLNGCLDVPANELARIATLTADLLGASSARLLIADYAMVSLQELGVDGPAGAPELIAGSLAGRSFVSGEIVVTERSTWIPVTDGSERLGVLELASPAPLEIDPELLEPVIRLLVLAMISKGRYTDAANRSRRSEPLSVAAEMQWGLLPPLTCSERSVSVSGILQPAYSIGGDSFDFALNRGVAEFAIVDAVGHGMAAVLISTVAINGLRNARREGIGHSAAYLATGALIATQFGNSNFATGLIGSLELDTGQLTWLNAGHPLPLLVRNGGYAGELVCTPSLPMGWGGQVREVATDHLQPGDRVLMYTDGVTETKSADGTEFGLERLIDFFVRATLQGSAPAETLRQLSNAVLAHSDTGLNDDATLLIVEYHGQNA